LFFTYSAILPGRLINSAVLLLFVCGLQCPKSVLLDDSFQFTVQLSSPMLISLTRCFWMIEALGILNAIKIRQPSVYSFSVYT